MLGADDEMGAAEVLVDDGVPQRFAGTGHAHGQGQQRQHGEVVGEVPADGLVAVHPRVILQIARLGHADRGMQQQMGLDFLGRLQGHLTLHAVHGFAGLKGHHLAPAHLVEQGPQLFRAVPEAAEVVVHGALNANDGAAHVGVVNLFVQVSHTGVGAGLGPVDAFGFPVLVGLPDFVDAHDRGHETLAVAQGQILAGLELVGRARRQVQDNGNGPGQPVGQPHALHDRIVDLPRHEPIEGREPAVHEQFEIADLTLGQRHGLVVLGLDLELLGALGRDQQIPQLPPQGRHRKLHRHHPYSNLLIRL